MFAKAQGWDSAHKNASVTLSGTNNVTVTFGGGTGVDRAAFALNGVKKGKWYWEIVYAGTFTNGGPGVGITSSSVADGQWLGIGTDTLGWNAGGDGHLYNNGAVLATWGLTAASGNVMQLCLDCDNNKLWGRVGTGNWNGIVIGSSNPATNLGGTALPAAVIAGTMVPAAGVFSTTQAATGRFARSAWTQTVPTGFRSFDDPDFIHKQTELPQFFFVRLPQSDSSFWIPSAPSAAVATPSILGWYRQPEPNFRSPRPPVQYKALAWDPRVAPTDVAPPAMAWGRTADPLPTPTRRVPEYPAFAWDPRVAPTDAAPPKMAWGHYPDRTPPLLRLPEYPAIFWGAQVAPADAAPPSMAWQRLGDLFPPKPPRLPEYPFLAWDARVAPTDIAPPSMAWAQLNSLLVPRKPLQHSAFFWTPQDQAATPAATLIWVPVAQTDLPLVARRLLDHQALFWAPQSFEQAAQTPASLEWLWAPFPNPTLVRSLIEYPAFFWDPFQTPDVIPPTPPLIIPAEAGVVHGWWILAREQARRIAKKRDPEEAVRQEIERANAELRSKNAAAIATALARINAAEAVLAEQHMLITLAKARVLERKLEDARRRAEDAAEEQDIEDLFGS